MGPLHFMAFFFIGIFHISFAKHCVDCTQITDVSDPDAIQYLSNKIKNVSPKGTKNEEQVKLEQIKEIERQVVKGLIFTYDFEARGLESNYLYECKLVVFLQEWLGVEEVKEYTCKVVPSEKEERSITEEKLLTDIENNFAPTILKFNKKKYVQCMKRAAIKCLL